MAKELADFDFSASPVNEPLVCELAGGSFLEGKRNLVLVGGTGTGKTHLAVTIVRACIRNGARGRCHNVVELVNLLEAELRSGRQGRTAEQHTRRDFILLDELGYLPFAAHSDAKRPLIPTQSGHRFRSQAASRVGDVIDLVG